MSRHHTGMVRAAASCALAMALASCGSETGSGSATTMTTILGSSSGAPSPAPSPTPMPTATPDVRASIPPSSPNMIADVLPGETMAGVIACASGDVSYAMESDGTRRISGVSNVGSPRITGRMVIDYAALDTFRVDVDSLGGPTFRPSDKRASPSYDYFRNSAELEIRRTGPVLISATTGRFNYTDDSRVCFYAAGRVPYEMPTGDGYRYYGQVDGLALIGGKTRRLFGSEMLADFDAATGELSVRIMLKGRDTPFGDFASAPQGAITVATARLQRNGTGLGIAMLTGENGSTGTITGSFFGWAGTGLGLTFELRHPDGDRIFGAVAADMNLI